MFSTLYAAQQPNIQTWTQKVLVDTLSASYTDHQAQVDEVKKNYLPQAWGPMVQFLRDKRIKINTNKLTLHPQPLMAAQVSDSDECGISPCWQVVQSFRIPELSQRINISLYIIPGAMAKNSSSPYVIQSLSLNLQSDR